MSVRTGNPGQTSAAAFKLVLAPGSTLTSVDFSFRYVTGYGPTGVGANLSLSVTGGGSGGDHHPLYASPHFVDHSYSHNNSDYSAPVAVHVSGIALAADADADSRLTLTVANNGRNLQILVPLQVTVSCTGADKCLVPGAAPTPPPTPAPPPPAFSFAASYGDHMVLQRAPQRATIWGFTNSSDPVQLAADGGGGAVATVGATLLPGSRWAAVLPLTAAALGVAGGGGGAQTYTVTVVQGAMSLALTDVLFGEVWVCSGQSNMAFLLENAFGGAALVQQANDYPELRLFTTAKKTSVVPLLELLAVEQPWSATSRSPTTARRRGRGRRAASAPATTTGCTCPRSATSTGSACTRRSACRWGS